jgi:hypothetical protein
LKTIANGTPVKLQLVILKENGSEQSDRPSKQTVDINNAFKIMPILKNED